MTMNVATRVELEPTPFQPDISGLAALVDQTLHHHAITETAGTGISDRHMANLRAISAAATGPDSPEWQKTVADLATAFSENGVTILAAGAPFADRPTLGAHENAVLLQPGGDKPASHDNEGFRLVASSGERSRLWVQLEQNTSAWLHLLMLPDWEPSAEPIVALRYLHQNDNEEVAVRFRRNGIVLHKETAIPTPAGRPFLVSLGLFSGEVHICLNGIPVYRRNARHPLATSYMLDLIGVGNGPTTLRLPLIALDHGKAPFGSTAEDMSLLATGFVAMARKAGARNVLHEALHSLAGTELRYRPEEIFDIAAENRQRDCAFSDVLEDLLIVRLPDEQQRNLLDSRPSPIMRVRDVSITLSSNPADKNFRNIFRSKKKVKVVENISFDAFSGDIVGIIGKNGAGKTTFLKSLVGAIPISNGRIEIDEQPILLRPGAGMQPDLTGRQNIYKTGLYMNMSMSEIGAMIEDVIAFAELEDHIDRPFRYYSDGMRARLIFSMATAMPRDILLLDELLSAGDMGFQERAVKRLHDFLAHAKLVFVVQHTFDFVLTRCTKCLFLNNGVPVYFGEPRIATELYRESL